MKKLTSNPFASKQKKQLSTCLFTSTAWPFFNNKCTKPDSFWNNTEIRLASATIANNA